MPRAPTDASMPIRSTRRQRRRHVDLDLYLKALTGQGRRFWVAWIEARIASHVAGDRDGSDGMGRSYMREDVCWVSDLAAEVRRRGKDHGLYRCGDANISVAMVMGLILTHWQAAVLRAKCYNPARDVEVTACDNRMMARTALGAELTFAKTLLEALTDASQDHRYFPRQGWRSPYVKPKKGR